ncbi:MAG: TerB family tellurite resistance protein [Myxococcales bacterium]|jgi:uncharacterized tellurite resistance protein B-like protein
MSILKWLGLEPRRDSAPEGLDAVAHALEELGPERARFVAAFALTLSRVAFADLKLSDDELRQIERLLTTIADLPKAQAALVTRIAANQSRLFGATHHFLAARELRDSASPAAKRGLLQLLFAVSASDLSISVPEEEEIRRVASEIGLSHEEYVAIRADWRDKREVLKH